MIRRTSLNLDTALVEEARQLLGTKGTTDTIHAALAAVSRQRRLRALAGRTFEDLTDTALEQLRATPEGA